MDLSSLRDLSAAEKLRIVTELWNDIAESREPVTIPEEILNESSRRSADLKADPSIAIDEEELWRRVDGIAPPWEGAHPDPSSWPAQSGHRSSPRSPRHPSG